MGDWCGSMSRKPTRRNNRCKPGIKAVTVGLTITGVRAVKEKGNFFHRGGVFFLDWPFNG